jgi:hypothetical protein
MSKLPLTRPGMPTFPLCTGCVVTAMPSAAKKPMRSATTCGATTKIGTMLTCSSGRSAANALGMFSAASVPPAAARAARLVISCGIDYSPFN